MTRTRYVFDTAEHAERDRLAANAELWDPFTFRMLDEVGVASGWRCFEVGAGTGTVVEWLLDRIGPDGSVVATDIETRWLTSLGGPNLEVRHHNVADDPVEESGYDLIHARLVLEHLPQRDAIAARLVQALRPGGWLVLEDYDIRAIGVTVPECAPWTVVHRAAVGVLRDQGSDPMFGSRLLPLLQSIGLVDVRAEGTLQCRPVPDLAPVFRPVLERLRAPMVDSGRATEHDVDRAIGAFTPAGAPVSAYTPILVSARGRRPPRTAEPVAHVELATHLAATNVAHGGVR
jgi:SAM-dependent methyltransferase